MEGFEGSTRLLQIADDIKELKTICTCGSKATINIRYYDGKPTFEGEQIIIDNTDSIRYSSVCGKCYLECKNKETFSNRNLN